MVRPCLIETKKYDAEFSTASFIDYLFSAWEADSSYEAAVDKHSAKWERPARLGHGSSVQSLTKSQSQSPTILTWRDLRLTSDPGIGKNWNNKEQCSRVTLS